MKKRFVVGHTSGQGSQAWFDTEEQASKYIGDEINQVDPHGVCCGDYYIDDLEHPDAPKTRRMENRPGERGPKGDWHD